jgi:hypothetical protein
VSSSRRDFVIAGAIAGAVIVLGEAVLNGWILLSEWNAVVDRLGLPAPRAPLVLAGFLKLFVLGYVLVWLYNAFVPRYGKGATSALLSGGLVAGLVWVWVMLGMLMTGYVTWTIAWVTMIWGIVELPLAALLAAYYLER